MLGILDRNDKSVILYILGNQRTTEVIRPIIERHVQTNPDNPTRIYTDGAPFYNFLHEVGSNYRHIVVVHDRTFGKGIVHTNGIE